MRHDIIKQAIAQRAGNGPDADAGGDAGGVAAAVASILRSLYDELDSVVGAQAAGSLCAHALHRTRPILNWTVPATAMFDSTMLAALRNDLAARTPHACLLAGETLVLALVDHLIALIGEPMTYQMLHAAWNLPAGQQNPQEIF